METDPFSEDQISPPFDATEMFHGSDLEIDMNAFLSPNIWLDAPISNTVESEVATAENAVS